MRKEFKIGDIVTVDRYNHIDDIQKGTIVGYDEVTLKDRLSYRVNINGLIINTSGISIMESKYYKPVPDEDRHDKL